MTSHPYYLARLTNNKVKGFTLIELLVVISILGLLASVVLVAINQARPKARDGKRITDMSQISKGLEIYYSKHNHYPPVNSGNTNTVQNWDNMTTALVSEGIIAKNTQDASYPSRYYSYMVPSGTEPNTYRIRARLEDSGNQALKNGIIGAFIYSNVTTGDSSCDSALQYYCLGYPGVFNSGYGYGYGYVSW